VNDSFDVVVVGSGAGGGVVAGELALRGRSVLLLELGSHYTARDFTRWESRAAMELMWPLRFAFAADGDVIAFLGGRCVGGTTTINTKVALRAHARDVAKWHPASGLTSDGSTPFADTDLAPYYERVERVLGVRERDDWSACVHTVEPAFRELGAPLEAVTAYTDANCSKCGSCIQGCPTNAGKSTMNTYIADALAAGAPAPGRAARGARSSCARTRASSASSSRTARRRASSTSTRPVPGTRFAPARSSWRAAPSTHRSCCSGPA
jgi:choline dehydrogenase-like flavoprotein